MLSLKLRTIIFVSLAAVTVGLCSFFPNAATNPESGLVIWLPPTFQNLEGKREEMSEDEVLWLPKDTTQLKMVYSDPAVARQLAEVTEELARQNELVPEDQNLDYLERLRNAQGNLRTHQMLSSLSATLILAGSDPRSLHRPEVCMPAQGWQITKREVVSIETTGGPLEVMDLHLLRYWQKANGEFFLDEKGEKISQRAHYVYWLVGRDESTPYYWEMKLRGVLNNMFKNVNDRWGYPSVMVWVDENKPGDEGEIEARTRIVDFIKEVAPQYQKSLGAEE